MNRMIRTHTFVDGAESIQEGIVPSGWIEVVAPTTDEQHALVSTLGLHELAVEDTLREAHPPKVEEFEDHLFVIAHTPVTEGDRVTRKLSVFLNKHWVVTVLRAPIDNFGGVHAQVSKKAGRYLTAPAELAHLVFDAMTDGFESRVDEIADQIEQLEDDALSAPDPAQMGAILDLRRRVATLARTVRGQRDVFLILSRIDHHALPKNFRPYYRDIYDHVLRVHDLLEGAREAIGAARDAHLASINNRLSEVMRVLTIIATIMMPLSLIAGVYGMNFAKIPGLDSPLGFWITMGAMLAIAGAMLGFFRMRKWI